MGDIQLLKQIGERIFNRRKSLKMTQSELAEKISVSTQMISNLECGKKAIRPENLVKICEALNISSDYILTGKNSNNDIDAIIDKLSNLSSSELKMVNDIVDYMSNKK